MSDASESLTNIIWTVYGKIASITKGGAVIRYVYDASGNRIFKYTATDTTAYVRDASGNVLSVYTRTTSTSLQQTETHLYGSTRLGIKTAQTVPDTVITLSAGFIADGKRIFTRAEKIFELSNHLGNVLVTLSDRRVQHSAGGTTVDYYRADIASANDYYPFGMMMPGRKYSSSASYRYGFNGKENDNEVKGEGNQQDYGMRIYDVRIGRFASVDPITRKYPELTPYQFASNRPIDGIDLDGLEYYSSKSSRIAIGLSYDPVQKKITEFSTYYRVENIPDRLNSFIKYYNNCSNCIGSSAAEVAIFKLEIKDALIKTQSDASPMDIPVEENSSVGPSSAGSHIRLNEKTKKERISNEKKGRYFTEGAMPRIGKANAILAGIDVATMLVEKLGQDNLQSVVSQARRQSIQGAPRVISMIQSAIDDNKLEGYLDQGSLTKLANYFLYGDKITNLIDRDGKVFRAEDHILTSIAKTIWSEYATRLPALEQPTDDGRPRVDNTGRSNRSGF